MDIYVDATYSNTEVAEECMNDIITAMEVTAGSRGTVKFHTFDGDPFRRRGISKNFGEEALPGDVKGTSGEVEYLEGQARDLEPELQQLIDEKPTVPGTPLIDLLERASRHMSGSPAFNRILICTDGLFTDVNPVEMSAAEARSAGEELPSSLTGITVDFIGLDGSAPDRGRRIEKTKPLVDALLAGASAKRGVWDLELGPDWRGELIAAVDSTGNA
jgi:hypothetical protein